MSLVGIKNVEFVSTALGQAMKCEPMKEDGKPIAIIDVGHISTSVCVYKGEGLALLTSFAMGGGHISSDLSATKIRKLIKKLEMNKNLKLMLKNII